MKYYKIVQLAVSGPGRAIYRPPMVVRESDLIPETVPGYLKSGAVKEVSKKDYDEFSKFMGMSEAERIALNAKEMKDAEKEAKDKLTSLQKEYSKETGIAAKDINKTWGIPRLEKEIAAIKANKMKIESLKKEYLELAGDKPENKDDWTIEDYLGAIETLKKAGD